MSYQLDTTTPFYKELTDEDAYFQFNGNAMQRAMYNLYVSKRDIGLNAIGMKPHSNWRVRDVKTYFGIKVLYKPSSVSSKTLLTNLLLTMCIIIIKQKSEKIPMERLKTSARINPHGLGIVWLDTFELTYQESKDYAQLHTDRPFIAHFRYATVGKINRENMHPFVCGKNSTKLGSLVLTEEQEHFRYTTETLTSREMVFGIQRLTY